MLNFNIKHHQPGCTYAAPHLFVLNKGMNTGKPLQEPCPNCFVLLFYSTDDLESMKHILHSLWLVKYWHQFLIGSVISYIRIKDFKKELHQKSNELMQDYENHKKNVAALKLLLDKEKQFHQNIALINDMRRVILYRYIKR